MSAVILQAVVDEMHGFLAAYVAHDQCERQASEPLEGPRRALAPAHADYNGT